MLSALENERAVAHARLVEALTSKRYVTLLDTLVGAANAPELRQDAAAPAAEVVPSLLRRPWHKLEKRVRRLGDDPSDEELHEIRIRTKRVRYAADAVVPIVGKPARGLSRAAAGLQGALGDLNDAVVAAAWLDAWRKRADRPRRRACGLGAGRSGTRGRGSSARDLASGLGEGRRPRASRLDVTGTVRAAGGLVCRSREDGTAEILLVHRPEYDDWSFPKGKLEQGETEEEAAVREVEEETGLRCELGPELATTRYRDARGRPKTVRYWSMTPIAGQLAAANEIDDATFVPLAEAADLLTYERDRDLLARLGVP